METVLLKLGLTPEKVRAQWVPRKGSCGRRGLPDHVVAAMYADYQRLGCIEKVAPIYGRTRQSVWEVFKSRGLALNASSRAKLSKDRIEFEGRIFTPDVNNHYRATCEPREYLHYLVWQRTHGPIPDGHQITFKDGNPKNITLENLLCAPIAEVTRHHLRRHIPEIMALTPEQRRERKKKIALAAYYAKRDKYREQGLRSDGKPRRRPTGQQRTPLEKYQKRAERLTEQGMTTRGTPRKYRRRLPATEQAWRELRAEMGEIVVPGISIRLRHGED
jgi:hypothetical protein